MSLILTLEERYNMSPLESRFVDLYNSHAWQTSQDRKPLAVFANIPNPSRVDIYFELEKIDEWLRSKQSSKRWKVNEWIDFLTSWLGRVKRPKLQTKDRDIKNMPYYMVMYDKIIERSANRMDFPEEVREKYWRMWSWLTEGIEPTRKDRSRAGKAMKEWIEKIALNYDKEQKKIYYKKLNKLVERGDFDNNDMLDFLGCHSAGVLNEVLDLLYGPELDRPDLDKMRADVTLRIDRSIL